MSNPLTIKGNWDNFDTQYYYSQYPDLQLACRNLNEDDRHQWLLSHFYNNGFNERRHWRLKTYNKLSNKNDDDNDDDSDRDDDNSDNNNEKKNETDSDCECCRDHHRNVDKKKQHNRSNKNETYRPKSRNLDKNTSRNKSRINKGDIFDDIDENTPRIISGEKYRTNSELKTGRRHPIQLQKQPVQSQTHPVQLQRQSVQLQRQPSQFMTPYPQPKTHLAPFQKHIPYPARVQNEFTDISRTQKKTIKCDKICCRDKYKSQ